SESDGAIARHLTIAGKTGPGKAFSLRIEPATERARPTRRLTVEFSDAGTMLRGLGVTQAVSGGVLSLTGTFDDATRDHTLTGPLEAGDFRVVPAPALAKLLQAVTFYGLVDALSGPGVRFAALDGSFRYRDDALELWDWRAFSPSLGLTANGRIDLARDTVVL